MEFTHPAQCIRCSIYAEDLAVCHLGDESEGVTVEELSVLL